MGRLGHGCARQAEPALLHASHASLTYGGWWTRREVAKAEEKEMTAHPWQSRTGEQPPLVKGVLAFGEKM